MIITSTYLTNDTGAYFNDTERIENYFHAKWDEDKWDKSSLDFDGSVVRCVEGRIFSTIKNSSDDADMTFSTWRYFVFKVSASKTPIGDPIDTGVVPFLDAGGSGEISSTGNFEDGMYQFKLRRPKERPGGQREADGYSYIWSDVITVPDCKEVNTLSNSSSNTEKESSNENSIDNTEIKETSTEDSSSSEGSNTEVESVEGNNEESTNPEGDSEEVKTEEDGIETEESNTEDDKVESSNTNENGTEGSGEEAKEQSLETNDTDESISGQSDPEI
jgi:YqxM protein